MICRPGRPSSTTSALGDVKAAGNRSSPYCANANVAVTAATPPRAPGSWTARACRSPIGGWHGFDGAKKVNGRKRHLLIDSLGLLLRVRVTAGNMGDRDDGAMLLHDVRAAFPTLQHGWVDAGYRGAFLDWAREVAGIRLQVVQGRDGGRRRRWLPPAAPPSEIPRFAVAPRKVGRGAYLRLAWPLPPPEQGL